MKRLIKMILLLFVFDLIVLFLYRFPLITRNYTYFFEETSVNVVSIVESEVWGEEQIQTIYPFFLEKLNTVAPYDYKLVIPTNKKISNIIVEMQSKDKRIPIKSSSKYFIGRYIIGGRINELEEELQNYMMIISFTIDGKQKEIHLEIKKEKNYNNRFWDNLVSIT